MKNPCFLLLIFTLCFASSLPAQKIKSYPDSAEFSRTFVLIYQRIKPDETIREMAERQVRTLLPRLMQQGIDSNDVLKTAYDGLDEETVYKTYFDAYRKKLTAKELNDYLDFLKTPSGAKIHAVSFELMRPLAEVENFVTKTINTNLIPIRNAVLEKKGKVRMERDQMMRSDTTEAGRRYQRQREMRDSLMKERDINARPPGN